MENEPRKRIRRKGVEESKGEVKYGEQREDRKYFVEARTDDNVRGKRGREDRVKEKAERCKTHVPGRRVNGLGAHLRWRW